MSDPTFADAITAQTQTQIRDGLLASLAADGSVVGGLPTSSPDRGLIEGEAAHIALEQSTRASVARSLSVTTAIEAGDTWVDAAATWFRVSNGAGGYGRIAATKAAWTVGLVVAPAAAPVTLQPGQTLQIQAADSSHSVFALSISAATTLNVGSSYKASVQVTARLPGTVAGNVSATELQNGQIITSGVAGLTVDVSVLPVRTTAARDQETSAQLADRCIASWARLGAAWTEEAFGYLIPLFAPTVTGWYVDTSNPVGPGSVQIWLRDAAGPASGPSSDATTECGLVYAGLTAKGTKPIGSGPVSVVPAVSVPLTVTAVLFTDGSNSTLVADAEAALAALTDVFQGPAVLRTELITALLMGGAFDGPVEAPATGTTPSTTFRLVVPGFGGVGAITPLTFSPSLPLVLTSGQILDITPAISTASL